MILITSNSCPPCNKLKVWLKHNKLEGYVRILDSKYIESVNLITKHNIRGVPALIHNGSVVVGYDDITEAIINNIANQLLSKQEI
jgi:glutaredoxin